MARRRESADDVAKRLHRFLNSPPPGQCGKPLRRCTTAGCNGCQQAKGHRGKCECVHDWPPYKGKRGR